jgi:hypothetical protein
LKRKALTQDTTITAIQTRLNSHETSIGSLNDRINTFENNMNVKTAPLQEAVEAGGLAALIQKTVLGCLTITQNHNPVQSQPMDEDFSQTPRKLFDQALASPDLSGKKRDEPPSPYSRKGQSSPLRVRHNDAASHSSRTTKRD